MLRATVQKIVTIISFLFLFSVASVAQTTITSSYFEAKAGQRETEFQHEADDESCVNSMLSASGENQTWDFTASCTFTLSDQSTVDYGTDVAGDVPAGDEPAFSSANFYARGFFAGPSNEESGWGILELTASHLKQHGFVNVVASAPDYDTTLAVNEPVSTILELPLAFGTSWTDTTAFTSDGTTTAFAEDNTVDGWGTLTLPTGSYPALRVNNVRRSYTIFGGMTFGPDIEYSYEFLTNDLFSAFIVHDDAGTASSAGYRTATSTSLPVELASLDAVRDGVEAILSWKTLSEVNNVGFGIEHAVGDAPFREIAFVDGAGTVQAERRYSYTFALESTGLHRFRLRQVDLDGTFTYSPVVELSYEAPERFALRPAYPNPFNPSTTVAYELAATTEISLDVYDTLGRRVRSLARGRQAAGRYEVEFDAVGLPSGLYVYRLVAGDRAFARSMVLMK